MPTPEHADVLVAAVGAGGAVVGGGLTAFLNRKRRPAEVDSIVVNSAETTVQAALAVAAAEAARADREAARADRAEAQVESLLIRVDQMQTALDAIRQELYNIKSQAPVPSHRK